MGGRDEDSTHAVRGRGRYGVRLWSAGDRPPVLTPQFWINVFPLGVRVYDIQPDARNTNVLYACTHRGLFKTSNGGMTWAPIFGYDVDCLAFAQSKTARMRGSPRRTQR